MAEPHADDDDDTPMLSVLPYVFCGAAKALDRQTTGGQCVVVVAFLSDSVLSHSVSSLFFQCVARFIDFVCRVCLLFSMCRTFHCCLKITSIWLISSGF